MTGPVCFLDTETTGLVVGRHEPWEVDPVALSIGGYHDRHPDGNNQPAGDVWVVQDFAQEFAALTHGLHLAGAVVSFDAAMLDHLLRANGVVPSWHYHLIDVEALAAGSIAGSWDACNSLRSGCGNHHGDGPTEDEYKVALPPWDSNALSRAVGVDPDDFDRHTALGDCRWAKAIYEAVIGE